MPRINSNIHKHRRSWGSGCYNHVIQIGELVVIQQLLPGRDKYDHHFGHVVGMTPKQYRILIIGGPVIRRNRRVCSARIRGQGNSLQISEFPKSHPPPDGYLPPIAYEDLFRYQHGTEYHIHSGSEDSQASIEYSDTDSDTS